MTTSIQSFANHKRIDPWYHYGVFGLALLASIIAVVQLCRGAGSAWQLAVSALLLVLVVKVRSYALRVQDRIIRLEETLRMQALLDEPLRARIAELRPGQFVALRFAADGELAARMEEALRENLTGPVIKQRIQTWRPDTFRV
jgi:hypothetical protein